MQRTIRILRIALPIVFVGFVLLIVLSWSRGGAPREKTQNQPIPVTRTNDKPRAVSTGFEDTQSVGGRVVSHIVATRVVAYNSSWNTLENVRLTLYRQNGLTYDLTCPNAEFNSETKEANAKGGVRVVSSDGVDIQTAEIHYDGSRLTNNIPVQFKIDRWQGNAGALDLEVATENLDLKKTLTATLTPKTPAEAPMTIDAADGVFKRSENTVTFTQNVVMTRGADRISGDQMTGRFTPDRKSLTAMEGHGRVHMIMSAAAQGEDLGGRKVIDCDRFFSEVGPDGQIAAINAVGEPGLAHAVLDGPPKRDIVARTFRIGLINRAVHEVKAEWNVVMKEFGPTERTTTADHVTVNFDPAQHKAITAFVEGNVHFHDPKTDAFAVRANYDIVNDRVLLTAIPGFDPSVTSDGNVVKAHQIEFSPKAQTAKATGEVIAQLVSKSSGAVSADSTNLFPGSGSKEPVFVNADTLTMRQANKTAVFTGNVRAWQEKNTLFAQELQVEGSGDLITARGAVRTMLYNSNDPARKAPMVSKSDTLVARKNDRKVDLAGNVEINDETRTITSQAATFLFDASHKIERVDAATKIVMIEKPTNRKLTGEKATYLLAKRLVYIDGNPATATGPQGSIAGDHIVYDLARNNVQIASPGSKTEINYNQPQ